MLHFPILPFILLHEADSSAIVPSILLYEADFSGILPLILKYEAHLAPKRGLAVPPALRASITFPLFLRQRGFTPPLFPPRGVQTLLPEAVILPRANTSGVWIFVFFAGFVLGFP